MCPTRSQAEPIKLGVPDGLVVPEDHPQERVDDFFLPFELVFAEGSEARAHRPSGRARRPRVLGPPEGLSQGGHRRPTANWSTRAALRSSARSITDNCVPMREAIEERFQVPAISMSGSDDWLGEWTFSLPQGSMTDEPIFWADLWPRRAHQVGALIEQSLVGETYIRNFRKACRDRGIRIVAEEWIAQTAQE